MDRVATSQLKFLEFETNTWEVDTVRSKLPVELFLDATNDKMEHNLIHNESDEAINNLCTAFLKFVMGSSENVCYEIISDF